jgi:hypothetical protein
MYGMDALDRRIPRQNRFQTALDYPADMAQRKAPFQGVRHRQGMDNIAQGTLLDEEDVFVVQVHDMIIGMMRGGFGCALRQSMGSDGKAGNPTQALRRQVAALR